MPARSNTARSSFIDSLRIGALTGVLMLTGIGGALSTPITTNEGVLPAGTDLYEEPLQQPTELFSMERAGGKRSYQFNLGDMLFGSPAIFGGAARQAGISCNTCHQQGAGNPRLYVPGLSHRPGTFDTSNALFNPKTDNGVLDAVTPPSLRGARHLAPYGHDGRFPSLREFVHNAIVNEFAGPEPSSQVLDALVAYVREISFLPNRQLAAAGRLSGAASAAAHRGEAIFSRPFPHDSTMSCASCHQSTSAFTDHRTHDIGTGGFFKTPTLLNANFNAPYFHDGRYDTYGEVIDHFDRIFALGLSEADRLDLFAYLQAVGDGDQPYTENTIAAEFDELKHFSSVLETAIPAHDREIVGLAVESVGNEWREIGENFPGRTDTTIEGGLQERLRARQAVRHLVLSLRRIAMAVEAGAYDQAAEIYATYKRDAATAQADLERAEPWSLFNAEVRAKRFVALRQLAEVAK